MAGTVAVTATASDDVALDHVEFLVDGAVVGAWVSGPVSYGWNSRSVPNGVHVLTARAVDTSGNTTTSTSRSVQVANQTTNLLANPSLETASGSTAASPPTCWQFGGYGTNTYTWTRTGDAHSGAAAQALQISAWTNGDRKLTSTQDSGACAPAAAPGHTYTLSGWYKGTLPAYFYLYYRSSAGAWTYLAQSAKLPRRRHRRHLDPSLLVHPRHPPRRHPPVHRPGRQLHRHTHHRRPHPHRQHPRLRQHPADLVDLVRWRRLGGLLFGVVHPARARPPRGDR